MNTANDNDDNDDDDDDCKHPSRISSDVFVVLLFF